jgi:uncharacterized protein YkwD
MIKQNPKRLFIRFPGLLISFIAVAAGCGAPLEGILSFGQQSSLDQYARDVFEATNQERGKNGLSRLTWNDTLAAAGTLHCQDMIDQNYFAHVAPNGSTPGDRATAAGYSWQRVGENIAAGYRTPQAVMDGWMNSPEHQENILNPYYTELGVGVRIGSDGRLFWAQEFGTPFDGQ